jgi:molybdopterin-containing oxidoreductase family iron-sulfur binding subunit
MACQEKALVFGDVNDPHSKIRQVLDSKFSIRRRAELGTNPQVYYIL